MRKIIIILTVICAVVSVFPAVNAEAGTYLATGAIVTNMTNSANDQSIFAITVSGGTGPCLDTYISFPLSAAPDADTHKRAYAAALAAFIAGKTVRIYNYIDSTCNNAGFIEISQ